MCEQSFLDSVSRDEDGRYCVDLPVNKELLPKLGNSYNVAFRCLMSLERKFQNNPDLFIKYKAFIHDFITLGHAHFVSINPHKNEEIEFYMPHHAVMKDSSSTTKLRIVFNGSQPTSSGLSLNDVLLVGPVVQPDMFAILLRFRTYIYVFVSDIAKMYRQIRVKPQYQALQRILWRDDPSHDVKCLQIDTVIYGTAPASYLATRALVKLVEDEGEDFPSASKALLNSTFVDDILHGENDLTSTLNTMNELQVLLSKGKFELHKWYSNSSELMSHIPPEKREKCNFSFNNKEGSCIKTLGIKWEPTSDQFQVEVPKYTTLTKYTKRSILSDIAKVYDPLGFIAPVTVFAKLIMQDIWKANIDWDSKVPDAILLKWKSFCANLECLNIISVPRLMLSPNANKVELHGFADSSTKAYGCVVYIRCSHPEKSTVHLVCAKTRVAPLKTVSLPRLELCAALLLTKLMSTVSKTLNVLPENSFYWTDSMITLCWIKNDPAKRDVFVSNRVAQIQSLSHKENWFHVKSSENPADVASRGLEPKDLPHCQIWFAGPHWLTQPDSPWLHSPQSVPDDSSVDTDACIATPSVSLLTHENNKNSLLDVFEKFSSWSRLVRVMAYVRRFFSNTKDAKSKVTGYLTTKELNQAKIFIIRCVQHAHFHRAADGCVTSKLDCGAKSLKYLNIFLDGEEMLRVGGRLRHANIPVGQKFPLLLPARCHVTDLLIKYEHERLLHAGTQTTLSSLRGFVWPLNARNRVRHLIHKCGRCYRFRAEVASQIMADLPECRVTPSRPFLFTGIDFAGPLSVKVARIRKPIITKGYICIFVCLSTKAIHIELVSNLTTKEFLNALRRFISRRGKCAKIFSDNGTTFHGAKNELHELYKMFNNDFEQISNYIASESIEWRFIIPHSAHWGGLWESSIKLVKHHLKRVLGNTILCYEHLYTLLVQIEAIVNSRPITPLRDLDGEEECLTPAHFLIGCSLTSFPEGDFTNFPDNRLDIYHQLCKLRQMFWKRWKADYLNTLQMRYKWYKENPDLMLNTVVLLKDDNQPPLSWPLGRVVDLYKGKDSHIRAVVVKTKTGLYSRPITKIVPLPFEQNNQHDYKA